MLQKTELAEESEISVAPTHYVRSRAVVSRAMAGETLVIPIRGRVGDLASIYSFNHTGSLIWKLLEKQSTLPQLVDGVAGEYGVQTELVQEDVKKFLGEMVRAGLVEVPREACAD